MIGFFICACENMSNTIYVYVCKTCILMFYHCSLIFNKSRPLIYQTYNMRNSKKFIMVGMESFQGSASNDGGSTFNSIQEVKNYVRSMNLRSDFISVFDKEKSERFDLIDFE